MADDDDDAAPPAQLMMVMVGDTCVGKTSMVKVFVGEGFNWDMEHPYKDYHFPVAVVGDVKECALFDTAGQEDYDRIRPILYPKTDVVILVFSIEDRHSLENVRERWMVEIKHHMPDAPIVLVGNQMDAREDPEAIERMKRRKTTPVAYEEGFRTAITIKAYIYLECSAKTNTGIKEVIFAAANATLLEAKPKAKKEKSSCSLQ